MLLCFDMTAKQPDEGDELRHIKDRCVRLDAIGIALVPSRHPKFCLDRVCGSRAGAQPYCSGAYGVPTRYRAVVLTLSKYNP
jgi:hypothetical protein